MARLVPRRHLAVYPAAHLPRPRVHACLSIRAYPRGFLLSFRLAAAPLPLSLPLRFLSAPRRSNLVAGAYDCLFVVMVSSGAGGGCVEVHLYVFLESRFNPFKIEILFVLRVSRPRAPRARWSSFLSRKNCARGFYEARLGRGNFRA